MKPRRRVSGVTWLALAVLALLPALAWLQYSWLEQIADADRERRARTLQTAASQLALDLDSEIAKAISGLQLQPSMTEQHDWSGFGEQYRSWIESTLAPDLVKGIYYVDAPVDGTVAAPPRLLHWNAHTETFDQVEWPPELASIRLRFVNDVRGLADLQPRRAQDRPDRPGERRDPGPRSPAQRLIFPQTPIGDEQSIVLPVMRITRIDNADPLAPAPPDVKLLGFEILRFHHQALAAEVLPQLVRRHLFSEDGHRDYLAAVVTRDDPGKVVYESEPGAAAAAAASPDASAMLLGPRMGSVMFTTRDVRRPRPDFVEHRVPPPAAPPSPAASPSAPAPASPSITSDRVLVNVIEAREGDGAKPMQGRVFAGVEGHWRLVVKHRAGSLEAAVAGARTRNFVLSSGILALLASAIGLIVVSARRADRLARQQLEFVAAVSHELRTPVSVIGAAAGNLADGVVGEAGRVKQYGATIQSEARRLAETVERVLQLAGIAAGRAAASPSIISSDSLIHDALGAVRHDIESRGVTVEMSLPDGLPPVQGDVPALRSALQNLIGNAVKYSGDARWLRIAATAPGRAVRISVADRGLGIAPEDRKHIFEPFYRGHEAVTRQIQGSGLGLHLVKRIAEAHGGSVTVESEPGRGSTFTLELPVAPEGPAMARHDQAESPAAAGLS